MAAQTQVSSFDGFAKALRRERFGDDLEGAKRCRTAVEGVVNASAHPLLVDCLPHQGRELFRVDLHARQVSRVSRVGGCQRCRITTTPAFGSTNRS